MKKEKERTFRHLGVRIAVFRYGNRVYAEIEPEPKSGLRVVRKFMPASRRKVKIPIEKIG